MEFPCGDLQPIRLNKSEELSALISLSVFEAVKAGNLCEQDLFKRRGASYIRDFTVIVIIMVNTVKC